MNNEKCLETSVSKVFLLMYIVLALVLGTIIISNTSEDDVTEYQAALHISNWTNRTLNLTIFIFSNDWATIEVSLQHTENVTLTVSWQDIDETVAFIHSVGPGVYNTDMYSLEANQWRSILLV